MSLVGVEELVRRLRRYFETGSARMQNDEKFALQGISVGV